MSYNKWWFPNQMIFKRPNKLEIVKLVQEKEKHGWIMVKPIYQESVINKDYKRAKGGWSYSGNNEVVKYVAIMKRGG